jgi:hypothetical protein
VRGEAKKSARSDINRRGMLYADIEEKKRSWLRMVMNEVALIGLENCLHLPAVKSFVSEALVLLEQGRRQEAWFALKDAYMCFLPHPNAMYGCRHFMYSDQRERLKNELTILDLGLFAYFLESSFLRLHDVISYLWEARKDFYPVLSSVLHVLYWFRCLIEYGHTPEETIENALKLPNALAEVFGDKYIYYGQTVGDLLSSDALAKLREIVLRIANGSDGHSK